MVVVFASKNNTCFNKNADFQGTRILLERIFLSAPNRMVDLIGMSALRCITVFFAGQSLAQVLFNGKAAGGIQSRRQGKYL